MDYRAQKQVVIGLLSVTFTALVFFGAFFLLQDGEAPPSPARMQLSPAEPIFKDIEVVFSDFLEIERYGTYDAVAQIKNPNLEYGSPNVVYEFVFFDETGAIIKQVAGTTYILANETRYIIKSAIRISPRPSRVSVRILSQAWQRLAPFSPAGLEIHSVVVLRDEALNATYVNGVVRNRTSYNLQNVEVNLVLRDPVQRGKIVGVGATNLQLLDRGASRGFRILWPALLPYVETDAKVESNFFDNTNFLRDYGR